MINIIKDIKDILGINRYVVTSRFDYIQAVAIRHHHGLSWSEARREEHAMRNKAARDGVYVQVKIEPDRPPKPCAD